MHTVENNKTTGLILERSSKKVQEMQDEYDRLAKIANYLPEDFKFSMFHNSGYKSDFSIVVEVGTEKDVLPYIQMFNIAPLSLVRSTFTSFIPSYKLASKEIEKADEVIENIIPMTWRIDPIESYPPRVEIRTHILLGEYTAELQFKIKNITATVSATKKLS